MDNFGWKIFPHASYLVQGISPLGKEEATFAYHVKSEFINCAGAKSLGSIIKSLSKSSGLILDQEQESRILSFVSADLDWAGPFGALTSDPNIEEIAVVGTKLIMVYLSGEGWRETNSAFASTTAIIEAINKLARPLGRRITSSSPRITALLKNGCRLHATIPPLSDGEITIRKMRETPFTPKDLISNKTFSANAMAFLWLAMQSNSSILIAGNTGSGKTSTLNSLFSFVPMSERVVILEETPEIRVPQTQTCCLVAREELSLGLSELSADSLRMRPDRVIIGEARTKEEARSLFESLLSGQAKGSYATFHARSANESLSRLLSLGVQERDLLALDLIVVQLREPIFSNGKFLEVRRCTEIASVEVNGEKANAVPLFYFSDSRLSAKGKIRGSAADRIKATFGLSEKELEHEIRSRASFLESMNFSDFCSQIPRYGVKDVGKD